MSEEFLDGAGNAGADRQYVAPAQVAALWLKYSTRIPPQFAVAVARHESSYTLNERDTEPSGKQTAGIFQITLGGTAVDTLGDMTLTGFPEGDWRDLDDCCRAFAVLMERLLDKLEAAAGKISDSDFFAAGGAGYLAWGHNAGRGQPQKSIQRYGLDWKATRQRNAGGDYFDNHIGPYGDDCITGGPDWDPAFAVPSSADVPVIDARTSSRLRIGLLVVLLALLVALQWPQLARKVMV